MAKRPRPPTDEQVTSVYEGNPPPSASAEIRVISMKTPAEVAAQRKREPKVHKPEIRPLSDVVRSATPPMGVGYLAPPRDAREVRGRRVREYVVWGSIVVIVSSVVMLAVWFLAR